MVIEMVTTTIFPQKVKTQGRIVIPKIVRDALQISDGDTVIVTIRKAPLLPEE